MIRTEVVEYRLKRARSAIGTVQSYALGKGGFNPFAKIPGKRCDCSGAVAWFLHTTRIPTPWRPYWFETTNLWNAAAKPGIWAILERPEAGCLAVYPDSDGIQGHIAIVVGIEWDKLVRRVFTIIDCSKKRNGVVERKTMIFNKPETRFICLRSDL